MKLKALQLVGIGAVIIFGARLVLTLTQDKDEDPMRFAIDTAEVLAAQEADAATHPEPAPLPSRRLVKSAIDFEAMDLSEAEAAYYCEGIIMLGAADETGRVSDDDRSLIYALSDYGNDMTGAQGIDRDTAMVARQQRLLQAQYDLEDDLTLVDVDACREMARNTAR